MKCVRWRFACADELITRMHIEHATARHWAQLEMCTNEYFEIFSVPGIEENEQDMRKNET